MKKSAFQVIPGIGPSMARDLHDLEFSTVDDLRGQDPEAMYQRLMNLRGCYIDRCVLYVFREAVYYAENGRDPEKLKWWNWKEQG